MRRFSFIAAAALLAVMARADASSQPLNVLFIVADDLNCDLGCYGQPEMKTPNIDRLAQRGVRFAQAYCQYPLCSPSRSSFLTGRRPNATGVLTLPSAKRPTSPHFREKIPATVTLPQLFRNHGYFAARVGKLYHYGVPSEIGTGGLDDPASWDYTVNPRGRDRDDEDKVISMHPGGLGNTVSWLASEGNDLEQTDGIVAAEAVKLLERFKREGRPFFLGVGFFRPHTPYIAPKSWFDLYPTEKIELPHLSADDLSRTPKAAYTSSRSGQDNTTDDKRRAAIQAYHASVSFLDAQVGMVLDALEAQGLAGNTVVVFTSDHGYHLGDHGLWQKSSLFERSARVPLLIAHPTAKANGQTAAGVVEMIDLYPTLAALAGLPAPGYLDGTSLQPTLDDAAISVKTAAFSQIRRDGIEAYSVRTAQWRYTEWQVGKELHRQLFAIQTDPNEARNAAGDATHVALVNELSQLLEPIRAQR